MASTIKILDPVQGLIDYTNDIKPYHTKVIEAVIEYVGQETIDVSVFEDFDFTLEVLYEFDGTYICLAGGYGTPYFGDPVNIMVSSPDVSKTALDYPAIGTGFFIVLGDKTTLFDPAVNVNLSMTSSTEDKLVDVNASTGSPVAGGSFTLLGDKTTDYPIALSFSVVGSAFNDGDYTVASTTYPVAGGATRIDVNETVPTNNVEGFASIPDSINTGTFNVISSEYTNNSGIPHTTVFITGLSLVPPTFDIDTHPNRRFISLINTQALVYDRILGYSSALRLYETSSPPMPYYVADEGVVVSTIVGLTPTSFSVLGDFQSSNLFIGDEFEVTDSSGNNGTYTITSLVYEFSGSPVGDFVTTFGVAAVPDTNADGNLKLNIPSNVFIIDSGDYTGFFTQGSRVNITSGSHVGQYTTLNSQYFNSKTHIRVRETLIDEGTGQLILSTGANYIAVDGDVTGMYGVAQQFNIVSSLKNNGSYTTSASTYDIGTNTTQISITEPFDITDASGEIHPFTSGDITHLPEGYGATVDLCELVPQALSISTILEDFKLLMGHKFTITGTDSATNQIYIDDENGYVYNIFTHGSPPDTTIEITESGINNGTYNITTVTGGGSPPSAETILTVSGSPALQDSGTFAGSPAINSGFLLYQTWWQYYVTDISGNDFLVAGDATDDINTTDKNTIQHIFTGDTYTVTAIAIEGTNTRITVSVPIVTIAGSPAVDVTAGSPPFDDWIISI